MSLLEAIPILSVLTKKPRQIESHSWDDRMCVSESDVNLFCWKRPQENCIEDYLIKCIAKELAPISFFSNQSELSEKLEEARSSWEASYDPMGDVFWNDVLKISWDFLLFSERGEGTVHLKVISDNACHKFHTDGYSLRLFTTYLGKGTQWLPENNVNRNALGKTNELIVKDSNRIQQMETMEVGILKGEPRMERRTAHGIVHRSPEIEPTGEKRVILRVDI